MSCIFCDIANNKTPSHVIWQDDNFIAFLSIYPNTLGTTVVIPKQHYDSYIFHMEHDLMSELMVACKKVANLLDTKLNTKRCALIFEGMGVNHLHAKLYPLHGLGDRWEAMDSIPEIRQNILKNMKAMFLRMMVLELRIKHLVKLLTLLKINYIVNYIDFDQ